MKKIFYFLQIVFLLVVGQVFAQQATINAGQAKGSIEEIDQKGSYVDNINASNLTTLPIGIKSKVGGDNTTYTIGVTKARFYPTYTELQVFAKVDIPQKNEQGEPMSLFFGADNIKLSHDGGIIGDAKLALLGDINIPINKDSWQINLYGGLDMATGQTEDLTYVVIDCDGFKEMKISGSVEFSRQLLLPIIEGKVIEGDAKEERILKNGRKKMVPKRVFGDFEFTASSWNDILVDISLSPFVMTKKQNGSNYDSNFTFMINRAILDLSDIRNSKQTKFPAVYREKGLLFPSENSWKGVYIESLEVGLPQEFKTKQSAQAKKRISIGASELLIDKFGVSGTIYANNLFPLSEGVTDSNNAWAYSLDHISVKLEVNKIVKGELSGEVLLPITKEKQAASTPSDNQGKKENTQTGTTTETGEKPGQDKATPPTRGGFRYHGLIAENEYSLTVTTTNDINFDIWKANATLEKNSLIQFRVKDSKFLPKAILHGKVNIGLSKGSTDDKTEKSTDKKTVDFRGLTFRDLKLQTEAPMIEIGSMAYSDNISFGNFPVSFKKVEVQAQNSNANLYFEMGINLMDSSELKSDARIGILGKLVNDNGRQRWKFSGLDLSSIGIKGKVSGFELEGRLDILENHPLYGNGFNAELRVAMAGSFEVKAKAIFGKKDFRYWYFDASAKLEKSGYFINGFGGGAYYKMKRSAFADPAEFSPSGLTYEPYEKAGLGLKAMISFAVGSEKAFNGEAAFEMQFNTRGGLDFAAIYGKGQVLAAIPGLDNIRNSIEKLNSSLESKASFLGLATETDKRSSFEKNFLPLADKTLPEVTTNKAAISFKTAIQFDFVNRTTHGTLDVYINAPFISGVGSGGRAGWAVFHQDPRDWYLYIGTPDDRIGIKMGVAGVSLKTTSYFMAGTQLPGSPPPPPHVAKILGVEAEELNYMRDENLLANAGGFAFGADLSIDTGDLQFLIFYANFQAGVGFDIMLKNYGEASCDNTGKVIGIDGWYANGQSYAYLQGELGVRVKLLFINMKVPIISAGAAVLMQAKLPNPVWLRGYVGGYMNVLGGLIKGKFNFKMTIGKQCEFTQGGAIDGMKMITDVSPKNQSDDVSVFAVPQASFSMKVNEAMEIPEESGKNTYKVILERFDVVDPSGKKVEGRLEWSNLKDRANFISKDILTPKTTFKAQVEVSFQKMENGIFRPIMEKGQLVKEYEEREFTTGDAPTYIPLNNIQYAYPVVEQNYYLPSEYTKGYVQLKRGQDYLFDQKQWKTDIKIVDTKTSKAYPTQFNYDDSNNELHYDLPKLKTSSAYKLMVYSTVDGKIEAGESEVKEQKTEEEGNDYSVGGKSAENVVQEGEIERLSYPFNSSRHKTFEDKINGIKVSNYNYDVVSADVVTLVNNLKDTEPFEEADLVGTTYTEDKSLVSIESTLDDKYFTSMINPVLYSQLPIGGLYTVSQREIEPYGLVPKKAISIHSYYLNSIQMGITEGFVTTYFPYEYQLARVYKQDMMDIYSQIVNDLSSNKISSSHPAYQFLDKMYPYMPKADYSVMMRYRLPGGKHESQAKQLFKKRIE